MVMISIFVATILAAAEASSERPERRCEAHRTPVFAVSLYMDFLGLAKQRIAEMKVQCEMCGSHGTAEF